MRNVDVLVVGGGPGGLAAAARLAAAGAGSVEVLEREQQAGGVPRYCAHGGFGTWSRSLTGPAYARLLTDAAVAAGAVVRTGVSALDWAGPLTLTTTGPGGRRPSPRGRSSWPPAPMNAPAPPAWSRAPAPPASSPRASCSSPCTCTGSTSAAGP